jgi:hypothetical protein
MIIFTGLLFSHSNRSKSTQEFIVRTSFTSCVRLTGSLTGTKDGQEIDYQDNVPRSRDYHAPQPINFDQLAAKIGKGSALPDGLIDERKAALHPKVRGRFEFWVDSEKPRAKDLSAGHELRILTSGVMITFECFDRMLICTHYRNPSL